MINLEKSVALISGDSRKRTSSLKYAFIDFIEENPGKKAVLISKFIRMKELATILGKEIMQDARFCVIHPDDRRVTVVENGNSRIETTSYFYDIYVDEDIAVFFDGPNMLSNERLAHYFKECDFVTHITYTTLESKLKFCDRALFKFKPDDRFKFDYLDK